MLSKRVLRSTAVRKQLETGVYYENNRLPDPSQIAFPRTISDGAQLPFPSEHQQYPYRESHCRTPKLMSALHSGRKLLK